MVPVARLWRPAASRDGGEARDDDGKPKVGEEYRDWLDQVWRGDTRELKEGRFLHQQGDLRQTFAASPYWREVGRRLYDWSMTYRTGTDALLFQGAPAMPKLANKPWQSFLSRTWRENVHRNPNWPDPPPGGWWLPDNWFERAWDIVRTRFVVRYMDGVKMLAESLVDCAEERKFKLDARLDPEAKADGYYAFHVLVRQPFAVPALDYGGNQERTSYVEIQVMTELAEVVSQLTHPLYETRREAGPAQMPALWEDSDEHEIIALGQQSATLERDVLRIRKKNRESSGNEGGK